MTIDAEYRSSIIIDNVLNHDRIPSHAPYSFLNDVLLPGFMRDDVDKMSLRIVHGWVGETN
jgi:hypothetical protein